MKEIIVPLEWKNEELHLLDQRALPLEENIIIAKTIEDGHAAIKDMVVRGAPLIGFTALWTMILCLNNKKEVSLEEVKKSVDYLKTARPTAVNLEYELNRTMDKAVLFFEKNNNLDGFVEELKTFAIAEMDKLHNDNKTMAKIAEQDLLTRVGDRKYNIMTICNTGYLACGPMGTALGVIAHLNEQNKVEKAYPSETRPYMQGVRLTSYEMKKQGIPHDIVVEGSSSYLMRNNMIDAIYAGADRIAVNGDTANKIGTSTLSLVAKHYNVPFYIVAPLSSFDLDCANGDDIPIELRDQDEILYCKGQRVAPEGTTAFNPSFDITDAENITGIICEKGLISPVTKENLLKVANS
jgi:methylthioribose-1-phosphate isomerase